MQDYRQLDVWKKAHRLALDAYADSAEYLGNPDGWALRDQIRRAAISIPSNIAEGAGRSTILTFDGSSSTPWVPPTNLSMIFFLRGISGYCPFRFMKSGVAKSQRFGACSPA